MDIDLGAVAEFMATHARVLDRRRFQFLVGEGDAAASVAALEAYRNADGGYGWGLEPDLRSPESQPGAALHAFEVFEDIAPATAPQAAALCDWLDSVTLPDGGVPFALPVTNRAGCAPFWADADSGVSSLQITAVVLGQAQRVARHDPAVAAHPWLERAARYCLEAAAGLGEDAHALVIAYTIRLLGEIHDRYPEAAGLLDRLARLIPESGMLHVAGGKEDEYMRPLDFAPHPGGPVRDLLDPAAVAADLDRLSSGLLADGGWDVDWHSYSPAALLDWRGHITVRNLRVLRANGVV
ncbi:hypothetical protein [Bailinhaonella thermotolerans]|uniref:Uncharacterized protein n=1 Tax=Bailinhaonella thermotolerans TaxID=1070861 RepID=A0A3A4AT46_9ACTN|nr:hypothetical protein [Bailinhaonella thermotolerans]RJL30474.1 hypothetical protein D5H75_23200 [Bailinhaonella thermotolerans]